LKVAEGHNEEDNHINNVTTADADVADVSTNDTNKDGNNTDGDLNSNAGTRKLGLIRLQKLVLIGGPDDGVISPWQSRFLFINSYNFKPLLVQMLIIHLTRAGSRGGRKSGIYPRAHNYRWRILKVLNLKLTLKQKS
jgi:hypothetical protein